MAEGNGDATIKTEPNNIKEEPVNSVERTEDYQKLIQLGLNEKVAAKLDEIYKTGKSHLNYGVSYKSMLHIAFALLTDSPFCMVCQDFFHTVLEISSIGVVMTIGSAFQKVPIRVFFAVDMCNANLFDDKYDKL